MRSILLSLLLLCGSPVAFPDEAGEVVRVFKVFDGSRFLARTRYHSLRLSLDGVRAPAVADVEGQMSKKILEQMVLSKRVEYTPLGEPIDGVQPARVRWLDKDINLEMIRAGYAWVWPRDSGRHPDLLAAEQQARDEKRGLWAEITPLPPWQKWAE